MKSQCRNSIRLSVCILACALLTVRAQTSAGELRVEVRDASGAGVVAACLLSSLDSGVQRAFETGSDGAHTLTGLPAGRYRLKAGHLGFTTHSSLVELSSAAPVTISITLALGTPTYRVEVAGSTPRAGLDRPVDRLPAPAQTASNLDMEASGAIDVAHFLDQRIQSVFLNEIQGNPLQPDVNYRGYTASPLLGTPQGVSVYLDGARVNQPFGDIVSWDLIPRVAISEMALLAGSNPLFGLNTLGGALSLSTKDGIGQPGTVLTLNGGSYGRKVAELENGGSTPGGFHWFLAGNLFFEDGWREASPSNVRQFFGKTGWQRERSAVGLTIGYANNSLIGNGLQEQRFLDRSYSSVYTQPDVTANRSPSIGLTGRRSLTNNLGLSGNAYFRHIRTRTLNGDINEDSLDQALYQPTPAERQALLAAGYSGVPIAGANASNTPFPYWRCIANALLVDEPGEKCNGLLNTTQSQQRNFGIAGQTTWFRRTGDWNNQLSAGVAYDGNLTDFGQSAELGYLNPDRTVTGVAAFGDGVSGGTVDGEPFDTRVDLESTVHSTSVFATDTLSLGSRASITVSGQFNHTSIDNRDRISPLAGPGSLTGQHRFSRFNPAVGGTYRLGGAVSLFAGFAEGNRAPTAIELGCADPSTPCKLPNAMAGDPPLEQVVTRTWEAGVRGSSESGLRWSAGWFRAANTNDILFVASEQTGYGYFRNFEQTLRQGLEFRLDTRIRRVSFGGSYTLLSATFQSEEELNGTGNSSNEAAREGEPGVDGAIRVGPGDRIPLIPRQMAKAYADIQATKRLTVNLGLTGVSSSCARGNENNAHQPDGVYYLGEGTSPGYAVVNSGARFQAHRHVELFLQANNLFNRRYYSAAQLGSTAFTEAGNFIARPFPANSGEYPVQQATFYAPGAPRGVWGGIRVRF